jgi:hypothetical protein
MITPCNPGQSWRSCSHATSSVSPYRAKSYKPTAIRRRPRRAEYGSPPTSSVDARLRALTPPQLLLAHGRERWPRINAVLGKRRRWGCEIFAVKGGNLAPRARLQGLQKLGFTIHHNCHPPFVLCARWERTRVLLHHLGRYVPRLHRRFIQIRAIDEANHIGAVQAHNLGDQIARRCRVIGRYLYNRNSVVVLCQEGAKAPCCTRDEGGPFGAAL